MERGTAILSHLELKYLLIDSLKSYSEDTTYLSGENPYKFSINRKVHYIFIHNVHDSGSGRTNEDECRIQFGRSQSFLAAKNSGLPVLFLGYYAKHNVFTAWDPSVQTKRIHTRKVISIYSRFSVQERAARQGIAVYMNGNDQRVITFRPEHLGLYIENFQSMHRADEQALLQLAAASDAASTTTSDTGESIEIDREKYTITHRGFRRSPDFARVVLAAYGDACAMCGMQLELVQAAHIVPHSHDKGTDDSNNGVCLCALHHKAFDDGLVYMDTRYALHVNNARIQYLQKVNRLNGKQQFVECLRTSIDLPADLEHHPSKEAIVLSNQIRGIPI